MVSGTHRHRTERKQRIVRPSDGSKLAPARRFFLSSSGRERFGFRQRRARIFQERVHVVRLKNISAAPASATPRISASASASEEYRLPPRTRIGMGQLSTTSRMDRGSPE